MKNDEATDDEAPAIEAGLAGEYVDAPTLAGWVGMSTATLKAMRWRGDGPPFVRFGTRSVRYHVPSVRSWLAARTVKGSGR